METKTMDLYETGLDLAAIEDLARLYAEEKRQEEAARLLEAERLERERQEEVVKWMRMELPPALHNHVLFGYWRNLDHRHAAVVKIDGLNWRVDAVLVEWGGDWSLDPDHGGGFRAMTPSLEWSESGQEWTIFWRNNNGEDRLLVTAISDALTEARNLEEMRAQRDAMNAEKAKLATTTVYAPAEEGSLEAELRRLVREIVREEREK
jgi:hypothetical protein